MIHSVPGLAQDVFAPWELMLLFSSGTYKARCSGKDLDYRSLEDSEKVKGPCSKGFQKGRGGQGGSTPMGWGGRSPPTEVQDGVGGEHAQDDEGAGNGHSHVLRRVGQQHVGVHSSSKGQEATDA